MLRKLAAAIAIAGSVGGTFGTGAAYGLGLGDIRLNSALNQPLSADIELVEVKGLTAGEVFPNLATREDFQRAGVERPYFLSDIRFETVTRDDGTAFVRVTSRKPVVEPYLNFLMEVHWPSGRLLREYTLLLDPPSFSDAVAKNVAEKPQPAAARKPESKPASVPAQGTTSQQNENTPSAVTAVAETGQAQTYTVKRNDTLWEVALKTRPGRDVSPVKMMAALQAENPSAFINGNINLLKQGSVLNIPDRTMIETLDSSAARQDITRQNRQWQQGRVQVDATRKTEVPETARGTVEEDRLNIVTTGDSNNGEGADQGDGSSAGGGTRELESAVSLNQEQLDTLNRENTDLKNRLQELEGQIASLEKLVDLKSDQLAATQLLDQQAEIAGRQSDVQKPEEEIDYNYFEAEPVASPKEIEMTAVAPVTPAGGLGQDNAKPSVTPAQSQPAFTPQSLVDQLLANPLYLAAGGGSALLLALLALVILRRRNAEDEEEELAPVVAGDGMDDLPETNELFADPQAEEASQEGEQEDTDLDVNPELLDTAEPAQPETADALGEAEIYIAYGRYDQAGDMLKAAIENEPERADLRIKLLDVLTETQDVQSFLAEEQALQNLGSSEGLNRAAELRTRFPSGSFDIVEQTETSQVEPVVDAIPETAFDEMDTAELDDIPENEGLEFDLQDLEAAADTSEEEGETSEFDLDFDALETELEEEVASDELELPELQDLELDVALDSDTELEVAAEPDVPEMVEFESTPVEQSEQSEPSAEAEIESSAPASDAMDFDSELEQLDAELADLSADLELDGETIEKALAPETVAGGAPSTPTESAPDAAAAESAVDAIDEALSGLGESDAGGDIEQMEEEFSFLDDTDETATKLDLARAYMEMGDEEGAKDILDEVVKEGDEAQQKEAQELINKLGS